MIVKLATN